MSQAAYEDIYKYQKGLPMIAEEESSKLGEEVKKPSLGLKVSIKPKSESKEK